MHYLLWVLLNITLFLLFIYIAYQATHLLRQKFGVGAALFFAIALLSFTSGGGNEKEETGFKPASRQSEGVNLQQQSAFSALLEDNAAFNIRLEMVSNRPTAAAAFEVQKYYTHVTGFVAGHQWKQSATVFNYHRSTRTLHYKVHGIIKWKLLGIQFYAQPKIYKGTIAT